MPTFIPEIEFDQQLTWDIGNSVLYWFRIGILSPNPPLGDPAIQGKSFVITLAATDIYDVCKQLKASDNVVGAITSISQFIRPIKRTDIAAGEARGMVYTPNLLVDVPFDDIPDCINLSLIEFNSIRGGIKVTLTDFVIDSFVYAGIGGIKIYGSGDGENVGNLGLFSIGLGGSFFVSDLQNTVLLDRNLPSLVPSDKKIRNDCWCNKLSLILELSHNITEKANVLVNFLNRNVLKLPNPVVLSYKSGSWQANFHLSGKGNQGVEKWDFLFEWSCVDSVAGSNLYVPVWKFSAFLKQTVDGNIYNTRLLYTFVPDPDCSSDNLDFVFDVNTNGGHVTPPLGSMSDMQVLVDDINLFNNSVWLDDPVLHLVVSDPGNVSSSYQFDISPTFPDAPNFG